MAFNSPGGPFSVPDPLGEAWDDMVRRNRLLQAQNDPLSFGDADGAQGLADPVAGSAPIEVKGHVDGTISRGSGQDIRVQGKVTLPLLGPIAVGARGTLDPPAPGKAEVSVSGLKGTGVGLPPKARFYNTPSGELDVDLSGDLKFGRFTIRKRGTYIVQ